MARQRFQEGCVFKRGSKRKVWVARWYEWVIGKDGRLIRAYRSEVLGAVAEMTKGQAKEKLAARFHDIQKKNQTQITFSQFVEQWWKPAFLPAYKVSTKQQYELALKNYLIPRFGSYRLTDISKAEVQTFLGRLLEKLAPDSVHGMHRCLRRILTSAVEWKYLQENPARG